MDPTLTAPLSVEEIESEVGVVAIVGGPDQGRQETFTGRRLLIGTSDRAGLVLSDRTVSRLHCELGREGGYVSLKDLGSKNGVYLGGAKVREVLLPPGTRFEVGSTSLEVRVARQRTRVPVWKGPDQFGQLLGASGAMHRLFALLERVSASNLAVLVRGESGTGKELVARAIHAGSERAGGPFVVLDGAAMSHSLSDSELFGHVRGAFTGADSDREGAFERASGGTLFLDEVAELPLETQAKLLRAVHEGTVKRLGEGAHRQVDVRLVCATHADLPRRINEGTFREDLYYRLAAVVLEVPPLRERGPKDLALLAEAFAAESDDPGRASAIVTAALGEVRGYRWPGNVRELRSFVRRAVVLGDPTLGVASSMREGPSRVRTDLPFTEARRRWVEDFERQYLRWVLDESGGNVSEAARRSELARSSFYELMSKLSL